jgi:hypothetical protein
MLRLAISLAASRLVYFIVILFVIRLYGSPNGHARGPLDEWIERWMPFETISRALR